MGGSLKELISQPLAIFAFLFFLIPVFTAVIHGEYSFDDFFRSKWIDFHNSWIVLYCFLFASFFINQYKDSHFFARLALLGAFAVDFFYSAFKFVNHGFAFDRWQGSSGNPQIWGTQIALVLLVWLISHKEMDEYFKSKLLSIFSLSTIVLAVILCGSVSNFIGLAFAALAWTSLPVIWSFALAIGYLVFSYWNIYSFVSSGVLDIEVLKTKLGFVAKKFLPRIKLWSRLVNADLSFDSFYGMGFTKYKALSEQVSLKEHSHVHSIFFHNYLISGIIGFVSNFFFFAFKPLFTNKYLVAMALYYLTNSAFECTCLFPETQVLFWLVIPIVFEISSKSSAKIS